MDDDRIEVKVSQTADGSELVIVQIGGRRSHGWSCRGRRGGNGGVQDRHRCGRGGGDAPGGVRTGRDTEIECVNEFVVSCIVDANLARLTKSGRAGEGQDQMCVGIDPDCMIRGKTRIGDLRVRSR